MECRGGVTLGRQGRYPLWNMRLPSIISLAAVGVCSASAWSMQAVADQPATTSGTPTANQPASSPSGGNTLIAPDRTDAELAADAAVVRSIRELNASGKHEAAELAATKFIETNDKLGNPYFPEVLLLRGDARLGQSEEWDALRDWERIVKEFPESDQFVPALERELDVAVLYLEGLRRKNWIFRIDDGKPAAEEIIMRINERLPGSRLGEKSLLILADFYYKSHDLRMAAETYDVFIKVFPKSDQRPLAMQRRAYANIAQFKGPRYDSSGLIEAQYQIRQFQREYPAQADRAGMGDALAVRVEESAAQQLLETSRWYMRRDDPVSARLTMKRLVKRHPLTGAAQEALRIMEENGWGPKPPQSETGAAATEPAPAAPATETAPATPDK